MVNRETLKEQFMFLGINDIADDVLDKCEEICLTNSIDEEELTEVWMAFSVSNLRGAGPTLDTLIQMERKEFGKKLDLYPQPQQQLSRSQEGTLVIYSASAEPDTGDDILASYNSTPKAKGKNGTRNSYTPDSRPGHGRSPRAIFSPASFSPKVATPSSKYKARTNKGDAICTFGDNVNTSNLNPNHNSSLSVQILSAHISINASYMFDDLRDTSLVLGDIVHHLGEKIVQKYSLEDPQPIDEPHQSQFVGVGRICCDSNGRLNDKSLLVESSLGSIVPVDVSQVETFSLFPGQVVAVEGENPLGNKLTAKQIYSDTSLPPPPKLGNMSTFFKGPQQIIVAAGPFTQSDTMTYEPLGDLVEYIQEHIPQLVILLGPFIDASHPQVNEGMLAETFQAFFEKIVDGIMEPIKELNTHVIMVSSARDIHHHAVYPTPPYIIKKQYTKLTFAPDPCVLDVEGVKIGVTSSDILFHLGKEEISRVQTGSDRLGRLAGHILSQGNFYPLYPPAKGEINLDLDLWSRYTQLDITPHILILPSDLRCFIKKQNGCVIVNPERLAKGFIGGNFACLEVSYVNEEVNVAARIIKI